MTYLELVNAVLVRLREKKITTIEATPFTRLIGAVVNDAKDSIESAWNWSQLRATDSVLIGSGTQTFIVPDSFDNDYQVKTVRNLQEGYYLRYAVQPWVRARYRDEFNDPVASAKPRFWTWGTDDPATGNRTIELYPPSDAVYNLVIDRVKHQATLENSGDRLLIPSTPVVHLAVAMAGRERGEIGGTPTGELFQLADRYLSDAIAYDTAKWENEMDWYVGEDLEQTNVRGY